MGRDGEPARRAKRRVEVRATACSCALQVDRCRAREIDFPFFGSRFSWPTFWRMTRHALSNLGVSLTELEVRADESRWPAVPSQVRPPVSFVIEQVSLPFFFYARARDLRSRAAPMTGPATGRRFPPAARCRVALATGTRRGPEQSRARVAASRGGPVVRRDCFKSRTVECICGLDEMRDSGYMRVDFRSEARRGEARREDAFSSCGGACTPVG